MKFSSFFVAAIAAQAFQILLYRVTGIDDLMTIAPIVSAAVGLQVAGAFK